MNHQFTKRCGCNRILRARESCPTCAERRRAELHAGGVAKYEGTTTRSEETFMQALEREMDGIHASLTAEYNRMAESVAKCAQEMNAVEAFVRYLALFARNDVPTKRDLQRRYATWLEQSRARPDGRPVTIGTPPNSSSYWDLPGWRPFTEEYLREYKAEWVGDNISACKILGATFVNGLYILHTAGGTSPAGMEWPITPEQMEQWTVRDISTTRLVGGYLDYDQQKNKVVAVRLAQ